MQQANSAPFQRVLCLPHLKTWQRDISAVPDTALHSRVTSLQTDKNLAPISPELQCFSLTTKAARYFETSVYNTRPHGVTIQTTWLFTILFNLSAVFLLLFKHGKQYLKSNMNTWNNASIRGTRQTPDKWIETARASLNPWLRVFLFSL